MNRTDGWLALALAEVSPARGNLLAGTRFAQLLACLEQPEPGSLQRLGLKPGEAERLVKVAQDLPAHKAALAQQQVKVLARGEADYPASLEVLHQPPHCLFVKGDYSLLRAPMVAIVGSRKASGYGLEVTRRLARALTERGYLVISGGALGIDAAAHEGALEAGATIAVLGCGVDVAYPQQHQALFETLVSRGAVVSEYPLGTPPAKWRFPARNRLLAGLAEMVIVTDCGRRSGALITARLALEQGKLVGAVPHAVEAPGSAGPHLLLKQGAACIENADDVVNLLAPTVETGTLPFARAERPAASKAKESKPAAQPEFEVDAAGERLLALLQEGAATLEELSARSELPASQVAASLTLLETLGHIRRDSAGYYCRSFQEDANEGNG